MAPDPVIDRLAELEGMYRARRHHVRGYCVRRGVRPEDAVELVQETFARAVRNIAGFRGESSLSVWVYRIAQTVVSDHFRSLGRSTHDKAFSLDDLLGDEQGLHMAGAERPCADPLTSLGLNRALAAYAQRYPERAEVLHLVALNGWSNDELGCWLGRTSHAAAQYLSQCRQLLKGFVQDHLPEGDW